MDALKDVAKDVIGKMEDMREEVLSEEEMEQLNYEYEYESNRWENYF